MQSYFMQTKGPLSAVLVPRSAYVGPYRACSNRVVVVDVVAVDLLPLKDERRILRFRTIDIPSDKEHGHENIR